MSVSRPGGNVQTFGAPLLALLGGVDQDVLLQDLRAVVDREGCKDSP